MSFILIPLALGFLGSFHCVGMCGPIALALPIGKWGTADKIIGILLYNLGRVFTYGFVGILFGAIGRGFSLVGLQQAVSVILGVCTMAVVIMPSRVSSRLDVVTERIPYLPVVKRTISSLFKQRTFPSLVLIGVLNGLLPCGFVYMAMAGAIATASILSGAGFMVLFGIGTIPAMFLAAFSSHLFPLNVRMRIRRMVPVFMFMIGAILIVRGMNLGVPYMSPKFDSHGHIQKSCCQRHR
jgi:sulfite exporter TauE/SafE